MASALPACEDCGVTPQLDVRPSRSGWYVGAWCACGPVVRESDYFADFEDAEACLCGSVPSAPDAAAVPEAPRMGVQLDLFGAPERQDEILAPVVALSAERSPASVTAEAA